MNIDDVLAVVVSYNGADKIRRTIHALRAQVGEIVIVDNGSGPETHDVLKELEQLPGIVVERLEGNFGVGHALNRGIERARRGGRAWLLTMDQDSFVDASLMSAYGAALAGNPSSVCLAPQLAGSGRGAREDAGPVRYAITSGNLVRVSLFDEIGPYDEGFFIDCIDFDFCLRVRRAGHQIHRVAGARMQHHLGDPVDLPRVLRGFYARHAPVRRYYMYRNYMYMVERYLLRFPGFILKLGVAQAILFFLIGFYDPRPLASYRSIARGLLDYAARRHGPFTGTAT